MYMGSVTDSDEYAYEIVCSLVVDAFLYCLINRLFWSIP